LRLPDAMSIDDLAAAGAAVHRLISRL